MSRATTGKRASLLEAFERQGRLQALRTVMWHNTLAHRSGLNVTDFNCLNLLGLEGPLTTGEIAQRLVLTRGGAVTTMVNRLEAAGYVRRARDAADRRRVVVELVPEAVFPAIQPLFERFNAAWDALLDGYADHELEVILDFVVRGNDILRESTLELQRPPDD